MTVEQIQRVLYQRIGSCFFLQLFHILFFADLQWCRQPLPVFDEQICTGFTGDRTQTADQKLQLFLGGGSLKCLIIGSNATVSELRR